MKRFLFVLVALLSLLPVPSLPAQEVSIEDLLLELPEGFRGPVNQDKGAMKLIGYFKPHAGKKTSALMQFSVLNMDMTPADFTARHATKTNRELLMAMLGGIERRRERFAHSNYGELTIANLPANRIEWTGFQGMTRLEGIYYTLITGRKLVAVSLQDIHPYNEESLPVMQAAVEGMKRR